MDDTSAVTKPKVAVITGGASGFGLAVATALAKRTHERWSVHIFDINDQAGTSAASTLGAHFHSCSTADYATLAPAFRAVYGAEGRLDFVFANAGIIEKFDFYEDHPGDGDEALPPPPPDLAVVDINVKGTVNTAWLAMHYFRRTAGKRGGGRIEEDWEGNLVVTASIGSLYPAYGTPVYAATKHAVLGMARSMAPQCLADANVRVNSICPSVVRTGIADVSVFPEQVVTPIEKVVEAVLVLLDGDTFVDSNGVEVQRGAMHEKALEVSLDRLYFRDQVPYGDEVLKKLWGRSIGSVGRLSFED